MKIRRSNRGFTLIEAAIALAVGSAFMAYTYSIIANGIIFKRDAKNINTALFLTNLKMTQIDSGNKITNDSSHGPIPGFKGFSYKLDLHEEEIDLLKLSGMDGSGKKKTPSNDPANLNQEERISNYLEKKGRKQESATGGLIKAVKIKIDIFYPSSSGKNQTYTVETFKSNEM